MQIERHVNSKTQCVLTSFLFRGTISTILFHTAKKVLGFVGRMTLCKIGIMLFQQKIVSNRKIEAKEINYRNNIFVAQENCSEWRSQLLSVYVLSLPQFKYEEKSPISAGDRLNGIKAAEF